MNSYMAVLSPHQDLVSFYCFWFDFFLCCLFWLRAWWLGDRIPVGGGQIFRTRADRPWCSHSASYTISTEEFPVVERSGPGANLPTPFSAEVKERVKLHLYSTSGASWPLVGWPLPFTFYLCLSERNKSRTVTIPDHFPNLCHLAWLTKLLQSQIISKICIISPDLQNCYNPRSFPKFV
jgi:hypothetical protein